MADVEVKKIVDFDAALIAYFRSEKSCVNANRSMKLVIITKTSKQQSNQVLRASKRLKLLSLPLVKFGSRINLRKARGFRILG